MKPILTSLALVLTTAIAAAETAADRGFNEPFALVKPLKPAAATASAPDRDTSGVTTIDLATTSAELARNSSLKFTFQLSQKPVVARLQTSVWHQGTDIKPAVKVNGKGAGTLEPAWPSLAQRNYVVFRFSDTASAMGGQQVDYQGWLEATCMVDGDLLQPGENEITVSTETDQIALKKVRIEILQQLDASDTQHDFRGKPGTR